MNIRAAAYHVVMALAVVAASSYAVASSLPQDDKTARQRRNGAQTVPAPDKEQVANARRGMTETLEEAQAGRQDPRMKSGVEAMQQEDSLLTIKGQAIVDDDIIPDSLLNPRWPVQRTVPVTVDDLDARPADLSQPENLKQDVEYDDSLNVYIIGSKISDAYINTPIVMTPAEYRKWSERKAMARYFRDKNDEIYQAQGKEKFDFTDMHFDLGPAEKVFGPGGVRIKTQGTAELKIGATLKNIDNPSLPIRNRKTTSIDFDEKINLTMNGKVGDKVDMNLNYNTDATFDYDAQNMKLKYEGKEDEIIQLVEAGNISFPSNSSLITGASSLFGIRTDLQFGRLKLQLAASQKKSSTTSVSSKGGTQLTDFEFSATNYEENRHFFLARFFRDQYNTGMSKLPNIMTGISITRVEIWVTNKTGTTTNTRDIVALTDLGEHAVVSNGNWITSGYPVPCNAANTEYATMVGSYSDARDIDQTSTILGGISGFVGGTDFEKIESARLLSSSEYTLNSYFGFVTLKSSLQTDQVLAVAFEYTYGGATYQVGEFASDITDTGQALFVKSLKNTSYTPSQGNWDLMMRNVYHLASTVEKEKFKLNVKYQSDTTGVYLSYIPETQTKDLTIIKLIGADRLDNNNKANSNGYFDYVDGYTVNDGRVYFPKVEPFGADLYDCMVSKGVSADVAAGYAYTELYDTTKTAAKQYAEKDKFVITGQYKGTSANVISLGATNVPQGSVVVTAGGVTLTEGTDYDVNYDAGEVTILNQSIIDAGTSVNVSLESNTDYGQMRKTMFGLNWEYTFSKDFQMSGTIQHLSEQALTTKVSMGSEPVSNTLWGVNLNWKKESQWLTNVLDKLPFLHLTQPSSISFTGEFAQLIAGQASGTQDNAAYIDDFEDTNSAIDVSTPTSWVLSSVPTMFPEYSDNTGLTSGYNRALLAWYTIDPLFTRRSSSLTPSHIKSDLDQLSNHYVREVTVRELYPNRDLSSYTGSTSTLSILNLAFYPSERGPYNLNPSLQYDGTLSSPETRWGGMMRKLDTSDFETANVEYIEFWLLDPFIYTRQEGTASDYGGDLYFNLGEVSEDILADGKKFYESGMPVDGTSSYTTTQWGRIPSQSTVTYAFATTSGSRALQDVGLNGLNDEEELAFTSYQDFISAARSTVSTAALDSILADPANDDYHYFRGSDYDAEEASILRRYKRINNPQGNSADSETRDESYDTSYKSSPDVEDINQDYTLNEYEKYFQYRVSIRPEDLVVGENFIADKREATASLRNGASEEVTWYLFRIPLADYEDCVGSISDFSSIRFMRMFMTGFKHPIVLRFGSLDLVRGDWRVYEQSLDATAAQTGTLTASSVNIEENNDKEPVNYVLPPGISRTQDPTQPQLTESNEEALSLVVTELSSGESKAVYKGTSLDLRNYETLQMFVHANSLDPNATNLQDNQVAVFIRLGSDYKSNYYEYEIPLKLTPHSSSYDKYSSADREAVWPEGNMLDIPLSIFTGLKKERNKAKAEGRASYTTAYIAYDDDNPANRVTVMGNPTLGEVKTMMIGVRNNAGDTKSAEVWVNELRLVGVNNTGGWAAQGNLNLQLSDFGTVNLQGRYVSAGFGGLEESVATRSTDNYGTYTITTSLELGKFFPDKAKVSAPLYYSVTNEKTRPKYNPLDTDVELDEALDACATQAERDSIESIAVTRTKSTNFSLSNVRVGIQNKRHPMPYDPANFSFTYSHSHTFSSGETTIYEKEDNWKGTLNYSWTPVYKAWEPFKNLKNKSKWLDIFRKFGFNWLPQNISFNTEMTRSYYELQERDLDATENAELPLTWSEQFLWDRSLSVRWDLTKNLHMSFQSATQAEIEEPYTPLNKDLYPDRYEAWKDSVWTSIMHFGTPLDYNQTFTASYQLPLNLIPVFDWLNADASYNSTYNWVRGSDLEDGTSLGNTATTNRSLSINGTFNLEKLYNHFPFLKKTNDRFSKDSAKQKQKSKQKQTKKKGDGNDDDAAASNKRLPKNKRSYEGEVTLLPDTAVEVKHGKKTKRIIVSAKTEDGKRIDIKYKRVDENTIRVSARVDSATNIKVTVTPKPDLDDLKWYRTAQSAAHFLMMVRNVSVSYRNTYSMSLPGFMPTVGDAFGQTKQKGVMSPGLDFAFGFIDDSYIDKALSNDWLLLNDSVATPATTNLVEDLQIKATLEPIRNLKIDLTASWTKNTSKSIQYMYAGSPTTQSGTFSMTTISLKSAFESMGNANNGYYSKTFEKFCNSLDAFQQRVEARYAGAVYPEGTTLAGAAYNSEYGGVDKYSADVMVPAFLSAYTSAGSSLNLFPAISSILPNWSVKYTGLQKLTWFRNTFKSVTLSHAYKSIYSVGSYSSYSTWLSYLGDLGFITDATTGDPVPSSMYNISTVSITESFSPLIGIDVTFKNSLTAKLEYKTARSLSLSMTSVQLVEALSKDWVIGTGYTIDNFKLFGARNHRAVKSKKKGNDDDDDSDGKKTTTKTKSMNTSLKLRLDLTLRNQASITRDIATVTSSASSGNKTFKLSFSAEYTLSKLVSMSFYYDRQTTTPLLSSSSYPTTTQDFGLSLKVSLTK